MHRVAKIKSFESQLRNTLQSTFLVFVFGFLTTILITRVLGVEQRGVYTLLMTMPSIIVTIGRFGFAHSIVYNINRSDKNEVIYSSFVVALVAGILLFLGTIVSLGIFRFSFAENINFDYLLISGLLIPMFFITDVLYSTLQGLQDMHYRNFVYTIQSAFILLTALMVSFFWGSSGLAYFLIINLLSYVVVIILCMRRIGLDKFNTPAFFSYDTLKQLLNYGIKSHFGNIFKQLAYRIDVVIIACFLPLKELGLYAVAVTFSELIWKVPDAIGIVLLPTISADKNISSFQITARVSRMILLPMLLVCVCIFFASGIFLKLFYGEEFLEAQQCVQYLLPGTLFFSLWKIYVNDLIARGEAIIYSYSSFISAAIIIVLNIILLPRIGITGASISSSVGYIFATVFVMWKFKSYSSISLSNMIVIKKSELQMLLQQPAIIINKVFK